MMNIKVVVTSKSFSMNKELVRDLRQHFCDVKINDKGVVFNPRSLIEFISDASAAIIGLEEIDDEILKACPNLKIVSKYGVGLDNINMNACEAHDVRIGWTGGVNRLSVAEMALGFMLSLSRNLYTTSNLLKKNIWLKDGGTQLSEKVIGIIGVGYIGKELIRLLRPFKCKILVNDIINQDEFYHKVGALKVSKEEIFKQSDIITIHAPLTLETENLINKETLNLMKSTALLINTARGKIVHLQDLNEALGQGQIAGAALDVYPEEPVLNEPLLKHENIINTPHIGGNSAEAVLAMGRSSIEHLTKFFKNSVKLKA